VAESARVALFIPNLFLRVPVESAVRAARLEPHAVTSPEQAGGAGCRVAIFDLEAAGEGAPLAIAALTRAGIAVLAFAPHVRAETLAAARRAGAVALPRSAFLAQLPDLLVTALGASRP
jgi:hypothetical protein